MCGRRAFPSPSPGWIGGICPAPLFSVADASGPATAAKISLVPIDTTHDDDASSSTSKMRE